MLLKFRSILPVVLILMLAVSSHSHAQDVIRASGGTGISVDNVVSEEFVSLSGPTIRETSSGQLAQGNTVILTLPPEYKWDTSLSAQDIIITIDPIGASNTDLQVVFGSLTENHVTFNVTQESVTAGKGKGPGRVTLSGLRLRPTDATAPNSNTITNTGTTGSTTANYGDLSTSPGAISSIFVETAANGSGEVVQEQDLLVGHSIEVFAIGRDIGNNFVENVSLDKESDWELINRTGGIVSVDLVPAPNLARAEFSSNLTGSAQIQANSDEAVSIPSGEITFLPRQPVSMEIDTQPSGSVTAGVAFPVQPVIRLLDTFGNLVTTDNDSDVSASIDQGEGTLSGTLTKTAENGIITFNDLSLDIANSVALRFESSVLSALVSDEITVSPAAAATLQFLVQPSNALPGNTINPPVVVQLQDAFGNVVPEELVTVTMSAVSGNFLEGITTADTDNEGIAEFDALAIDVNAGTGEVQIEAAFSGIDTDVSSDPFFILDEGELAGFRVEAVGGGDIGAQTAGAEFDIRITAIDGAGNTYEDYDSTVTISSDAGIDEIYEETGSFSNGVLSAHTVAVNTSGLTRIKASIDNPNRFGQSNQFQVGPAGFDIGESTVTADPDEITADGVSTSAITVQLKDEFGNPLTTGGETVYIVTNDTGQLANESVVTGYSVLADDQGDGTYTAILTSSTTIETATIKAFLDDPETGDEIAGSATVAFIPGEITSFTIDIPMDNGSPVVQTAGASFEIDIQARDAFGNIAEGFFGMLDLASGSEIISGESVTMTEGIVSGHPVILSTSGGAITISVTSENALGISATSDSFPVIAGDPVAGTSQILVGENILQNDGMSQTIVTVILRDQFSNRVMEELPVSTTLVQLEENDTPVSGSPAPNATISPVTFDSDQGDYNATLTTSTIVERVEISAKFGVGEIEIEQKRTVDIVLPNTWTSSGGPQSSRIDWNNPENWSLDAAPTANSFVIIPDGVGQYPNLDLNITIGSLQVSDGANVTLFGGNRITVAGSVTIDGIFDIENETDLEVGGQFTGSGTFTAATSATVEIAGDISIATFFARSQNSIVRLIGEGMQTISTQEFLAERLEILQDATVTQDNSLTDIFELHVASGKTLVFLSGGEIVIDALNSVTGDGTIILNDNTLILGGNVTASNIDASEGTVVFGIRPESDFNDFPELTQQQIANLSEMKNAVINNIHGVRTFEDVIVNGELTLQNGLLIISSGKSLIAPNKVYIDGNLQFRRSINAIRGWRMMTSPAESSYSDLFDGLTVQGIPGTDNESFQPNLMYYDESADTTDLDRWKAPLAIGDMMQPGRGYFFFVFGETEEAGSPEFPGYEDSLPFTLTATGNEHQPANATFSFDVSLTDTLEPDPEVDNYVALADRGWNFVGNPFGASLDWDDEASWTSTHISDVIYKWKPIDHGNGELGGEYQAWNRDTGQLGSGLITPFQAFWVKANNANPVLEVDPEGKTTGGQFRQKSTNESEAHTLVLKLSAGGLETTTHFSFNDNARIGMGRKDAYLLEPMADTYLQFYSVSNEGDIPLTINNLPKKSKSTYEIKLGVAGYRQGKPVSGTYSVQLDAERSLFPDHWEVRLRDNVTGETVDLQMNQQLKTSVETFRGQKKQIDPPSVAQPRRIRPVIADFSGNRGDGQSESAHTDRTASAYYDKDYAFTLYVTPDEPGEGDVPHSLFLDQNYPNPFNPNTTITYGLPEEGSVRLEVYDILGRRVQTLTNGTQEPGVHVITFDGSRLASGVYIYRLQTSGESITRKMMLIK